MEANILEMQGLLLDGIFTLNMLTIEPSWKRRLGFLAQTVV